MSGIGVVVSSDKLCTNFDQSFPVQRMVPDNQIQI